MIGSPPCTDVCAIQNLNRHRWSPSEVRRRHAEAMVLLGCAVEIYWLQFAGGRHSLHEHPASASSWGGKSRGGSALHKLVKRLRRVTSYRSLSRRRRGQWCGTL